MKKLTKGKLYDITNMITRDEVESGDLAPDIWEVLDEAKKEFPKKINGSRFDYYDEDEIDEWFKKWFIGD